MSREWEETAHFYGGIFSRYLLTPHGVAEVYRFDPDIFVTGFPQEGTYAYGALRHLQSFLPRQMNTDIAHVSRWRDDSCH